MKRSASRLGAATLDHLRRRRRRETAFLRHDDGDGIAAVDLALDDVGADGDDDVLVVQHRADLADAAIEAAEVWLQTAHGLEAGLDVVVSAAVEHVRLQQEQQTRRELDDTRDDELRKARVPEVRPRLRRLDLEPFRVVANRHVVAVHDRAVAGGIDRLGREALHVGNVRPIDLLEQRGVQIGADDQPIDDGDVDGRRGLFGAQPRDHFGGGAGNDVYADAGIALEWLDDETAGELFVNPAVEHDTQAAGRSIARRASRRRRGTAARRQRETAGD